MNNENYFHTGPGIKFRRNRFNMPFQHSTAFNAGDIVPLMAEQIYPGDSWRTKLSYMIRMFTPTAPTMSNIYQDFYAFFIPWRIIWDNTKQFFGENEVGPWTASLDRVVPQHALNLDAVKAGTASDYPTGGGKGHTPGTAGWVDEGGNLPAGSIGDYMGLCYTFYDIPGTGFTVSDLFRRAYLQVYNDWFRDENIISPVLFSKGDTHAVGETVFYWSKCLKAAKFHDYFTSLLPEAMKGPTPIVGDLLPVVATGDEHLGVGDKAGSIRYRTLSDAGIVGSVAFNSALTTSSGGYSSVAGSTLTNTSLAVPSNLYASSNITIDDIRKAAVMTHVFERLAVSGSRYPEFLYGMWGVTSPDASLQVSEYLGGVRFPVRIQEVLSNADTLTADQTAGQPIGSTGAFSKTLNSGALFDKSFTEYGILLVVGVARVEQTYFQGIDRKFINKGFFDFYLPAAANLGPQPVYLEELNLNADAVGDDGLYKNVLGYSESYAYLRYMPWRLTSIVKPNAEFSLSNWTATDIIPDDVTLSQAFLEQDTAGLDRTLALSSANRGAFQFFGDFKFDNDVTRILPDHAIAGLTRI